MTLRKGFLVAMVALAALLSGPAVLGAVSPPGSSGCQLQGDHYSCGGSGSGAFICDTHGVNSGNGGTGMCDDACGASLSCDGRAPGSATGTCNLNTGQVQYCNADCQVTGGSCSGSCGASLSCDGRAPGSDSGYCNTLTHREQYCSSSCLLYDAVCGPWSCGGSASCTGYAPGSDPGFCYNPTHKKQTCGSACELVTATTCTSGVCGAECSSGDLVSTGCPAGQRKSCDTSTCKWGSCEVAAGGLSPTCTDETVKGGCSVTKPKYCDNSLSLVNNCGACGCPSGQACQADGTCGATAQVCAPNAVVSHSCSSCGIASETVCNADGTGTGLTAFVADSSCTVGCPSAASCAGVELDDSQGCCVASGFEWVKSGERDAGAAPAVFTVPSCGVHDWKKSDLGGVGSLLGGKLDVASVAALGKAYYAVLSTAVENKGFTTVRVRRTSTVGNCALGF
ncbi:hypothetical protein HYU40_03040 [Candidatus Woesearchaeota archaeon]|nr:hypothetical protein [Candidatus Woesearchaeota archaeon]